MSTVDMATVMPPQGAQEMSITPAKSVDSDSYESIFDDDFGAAPQVAETKPVPVAAKFDTDEALDLYAKEAIEDAKLNLRTDSAIGQEQNLLNEAAKTVKAEEKQVNDEIKAEQAKIAEGKETVKADLDGQQFEVPADAVVDVSVNGKTVPVKVRDALKAYSGQQEFNRNADARVHQITKRERELVESKNSINNYFTDIINKAAEGDIFGIFEKAALAKGQDPVELEKKILQDITEVVHVYTKLTPEQQQAYFAERRAEHYKRQLDASRSDAERAQRGREFHAAVEKVQQSWGLNQDEMGQFIQEMLDEGVSADKITPQALNGYIYANVHHMRVMEGISKVDKSLAQNDRFVEYISNITANETTFTIDDIAEVVQSALQQPPKAVQNLSQKVLENKTLRSQLEHGNSNNRSDAEDEELFEDFHKSRPVYRR